MKWYVRIAIALLFVIFSPIIILCLCVGLIAYLFAVPKNKKEYTNSEYFKDFNKKARFGKYYYLKAN